MKFNSVISVFFQHKLKQMLAGYGPQTPIISPHNPLSYKLALLSKLLPGPRYSPHTSLHRQPYYESSVPLSAVLPIINLASSLAHSNRHTSSIRPHLSLYPRPTTVTANPTIVKTISQAPLLLRGGSTGCQQTYRPRSPSYHLDLVPEIKMLLGTGPTHRTYTPRLTSAVTY